MKCQYNNLRRSSSSSALALKFTQRKLTCFPRAITVPYVTKFVGGWWPLLQSNNYSRKEGAEFANRAHNSDSLNGTVGQKSCLGAPRGKLQISGLPEVPTPRVTCPVCHESRFYLALRCLPKTFTTCHAVDPFVDKQRRDNDVDDILLIADSEFPGGSTTGD